MAATSHGFYGLGTSKTENFGLASNMTLPIIKKVEKEKGDRTAYSATMPHEKKKVKKKARFAVEQLEEEEEEQPEPEVVLRNPSKKPSWRSRVSSLFKRSSRLEKVADTGAAAVPDPENDPPTMTVDDMEVETRKAKKKRRKKRDAKSHSTAFEDIPYVLNEDMHNSSDFLKLALRPKNSGNDFKDILVTLKRQSDGFGIHLSGGLPPISVTYVQPGSEAESARIMVGDIVTEVNGHDCRKGVGISQIMELKSLIQQTPSDHDDASVDEDAWEKIKEKQVELDSDSSDDNEVTRIDESSESDTEQTAQEIEPPKTEEPSPKVEPKAEPSPKMKSRSKAKSPSKAKPSSPKASPKGKSKVKSKTEEPSPLVKSQKASPKVEQPQEVEPMEVSPKSSTRKKKSAKKKKRETDVDSEPKAEVSPIKVSSSETPPASRSETPLGSPTKDLSSPPSDSPKMVTVGIIKKPKGTKKTRSSHEAKRMETDVNESVTEKSMSLAETSANASSMIEESKEPAKKRKKKRPKEQSPTDAVNDTSAATITAEESIDKMMEEINEMVIDETPTKSKSDVPKKKKKRRPKEEPPVDNAVDDHSAVAMTTEESLDKLLDEINEITTDDTPQKPDKDVHKKKSSHGKGKPKKKRAKTAETSLDGGPKKKRVASSNAESKPKSSKSAKESGDLEYVDYGQETPENFDRARKSEYISDLTPITSEKRSTSYHDLDKEDRKMFREELREASKSEYDMQESAKGGQKVEIDPNVRVKKSGVVIGKRKTNERPSIFDDEGAEGEDMGEEESARTEGKKAHRKLIMEADLSAVPETSPSLGLKHGHDKMDVINRSVSKRRPASKRKTLLLDSKKEVLMGNERVDLSAPGDGKLLRQQSTEQPKTSSKAPEPIAHVNEPQPRPKKQSIAEYMASLQKAKYSKAAQDTSMLSTDLPATIDETRNISPSVAKRIFEGPRETNPPPSPRRSTTEKQAAVLTQRAEATAKEHKSGGGRKIKTVEQPVKKLGIASESEKSTSQNGAPEWVSLAQTKSKRSSSMYSDNKPTVQSQSTKTVPPNRETQHPALPSRGREDESIPKMGTVLDALARFQNVK